MNSHYNTLLASVTGEKSTPLKEITDTKLREKHMLVKQLGPLLGVKDSQLKRIIAGESGTRPEIIGAFQEFLDVTPEIWAYFWDADTNSARSFDDYSTLLAISPYSEPETPSQMPQIDNRKTRGISLVSTIVIGLALGSVVFMAITGFNTKKEPPVAMNLQGPCLVELRNKTLPAFTCDGIGAFTVSGSSLEKWNTKTSLVYVPDNWEVIARYETWGGQNYSVLQEDKSGFVKLSPGFNHFDSDTYEVFDNEALDGRARRSMERELNDRVQYLIVTKAHTDDEIIVWEHDEKNDPNQISIALVQL